jgi:hypothetical protein
MIILQKAINMQDKDTFDNLYQVQFYISNCINPIFYVYGNNCQGALDTLIDFLNDIKENIYTLDNEEVKELTNDEIDNDYIHVGNYCQLLRTDTFNITEVL